MITHSLLRILITYTDISYSGPAYYESLAVFPQTSRFIVDVNLGNSSVDIAQKEIEAAIKYIGWDRIYSLERK